MTAMFALSLAACAASDGSRASHARSADRQVESSQAPLLSDATVTGDTITEAD